MHPSARRRAGARALALLLLFAAAAAQTTPAPPAAAEEAADALNGGADHRAHAVAGGPYLARADRDATPAGAVVGLNGARSHSHYYNPGTGESGRIETYEWSAPGRGVVCEAVRCDVTFPFGTTALTLRVVDATGSEAAQTTSVTVSGLERKGLRVAWAAAGADGSFSAPPIQAAVVTEVGGGDGADGSGATPAARAGAKIRAEYQGYLTAEDAAAEVQFRVRCGGAGDAGGYCYADVGGVVMQGETGGAGPRAQIGVGEIPLYVSLIRNEAAGAADFVALEWRAAGKPGGKMSGWGAVDASWYSYTPSDFPPVVNSVDQARVGAGSVVKLRGLGFEGAGARVDVAGAECASLQVVSDAELTCVVPNVSGAEVDVVMSTAAGASNPVMVPVRGAGAAKQPAAAATTAAPAAKEDEPAKKKGTSPAAAEDEQDDAGADGTPVDVGDEFGAATGEGVGYYQPVAFEETFLKNKDGSKYELSQVTSVAVGPDGRYYFGGLNGKVHALTVNAADVVTAHCTSAELAANTAIMGVAFNPADFPAVRVYASLSVLYYGEKLGLPIKTWWRNGKVVTLGVGGDGEDCLKMENDALVTGLPVSNHDHGINGIQFDDAGVMYVSVGGSTNGGVSIPGDLIGGVPDSPFSGAIVKAPVLNKGFNGKIEYTRPGNPGLTDVKPGFDVSSYADGLRNAYSHVIHSNGKHYAVDNGANEGFGDWSTGCGPDDTKPAKHDGDALRLISQGAWTGYANLNRGRNDPRQCVQMDLQSGASEGYTQQIDNFESATTGLLEYTSNRFGASMRGNLLATKFAIDDTGKTFRVSLSGDGSSVDSKYELAAYSGLSAAMTPYGGVALARVWQGHVALLKPIEVNPKVVAVGTVTPGRGPKSGGNTVLITGWNFKAPLSATFGGKPCTGVKNIAKDGTSFRCTAPAGAGKVPVVVKSGAKSSQSYGWEYSYMTV